MKLFAPFQFSITLRPSCLKEAQGFANHPPSVIKPAVSAKPAAKLASIGCHVASPHFSSLACHFGSRGDGGAITLWNLERGEYLRMLRRDRPYERLDIRGVKGLTEAQTTLRALGAIELSPPTNTR